MQDYPLFPVCFRRQQRPECSRALHWLHTTSTCLHRCLWLSDGSNSLTTSKLNTLSSPVSAGSLEHRSRINTDRQIGRGIESDGDSGICQYRFVWKHCARHVVQTLIQNVSKGSIKVRRIAELSSLFLGVAPLHVDALPTTLPTAVHFETVPFGTETSPPKAFY